MGKRSEVVSIDDSKNALDLLKHVSSLHGQRFLDFVFDSNKKIKNGLAFAIDGNSIQKSALSKIELTDISEFVILPPISGGVQ